MSSVARLFDELAPTYDQTGVDFFAPVGARLVELLSPAPGEHAVDVGCGRGAVTLPLAEAVRREGSVRAVDVSAAMVAATRELARDLPQVDVEVADGAQLSGRYDVVAASLVLFFLPDPAAALARWVSLLTDGGRVGLSTFGPLDDDSRALDDLLLPYAPTGLLDPRTTGTEGPFSSPEATAELVRTCGADEVDTRVEPVTLAIGDVATWESFSRTTGQRAMWQRVPEDELDGVRREAAEILDGSLVWQICYTVGRLS